jgi:uridine phosphorylase
MDDALIRPECGEKAKRGPALAVMAATLTDLQSFAGILDIPKDHFRDFFSARLYRKGEGNHGFFLAGPFIGSPHAAILLENLIARGVRNILFAGWCGTLTGGLAVGDVIIASGALSDEGTSRHYGIPDSSVRLETSRHLNGILTTAMTDCGVPVKTAEVWTTDALYRETPDKIGWFRDKGARVVEMELSALLAVARFRSVELSSLQLVSDDVSGAGWQPGFKDSRFKAGRKNLAALVRRFLDNMERTDHGT